MKPGQKDTAFEKTARPINNKTGEKKKWAIPELDLISSAVIRSGNDPYFPEGYHFPPAPVIVGSSS
ncbi:MAG: hypothetical protein ACXVJD_16215 [Mucilaginibacter sp.]